jgi:hypothetical protein
MNEIFTARQAARALGIPYARLLYALVRYGQPSGRYVHRLVTLAECRAALSHVKLLRERFASTRDGEILASAAGALREKQEEQQTLAASIGLTTNAAVRQAIIAQMETVAEEVQKLEAAYQEAQQVEEREQAAEAWIQSTLDKIYGWRTTWAQTVDAETEMFYTTTPLPDLDELPFDLKRVAVEASGIVVKLYPVGSEERIQVAFNQSISGTTIDSNDSALVEVATPGRRR